MFWLIFRLLVHILAIYSFLSISLISCDEQRLGRIKDLPKNVSVSGLSSGGTLAMELYLSYSQLIKSVAIYSSIIFHCGIGLNGYLLRASECVSATTNFDKAVERIESLAKRKLLDPLSNLKNHRHFISHGTNDNLINPRSSNLFEKFFKRYSNNVKLHLTNASHGLPTHRNGELECGSTLFFSPSASLKCNYSILEEGFRFIYDKENFKPAADSSTNGSDMLTYCDSQSHSEYLPTGLYKFDQKEFIVSGDNSHTIADYGFFFVPTNCRESAASCTFHIHFHGCSNNAATLGDRYPRCNEILGLAEANNIVLLLPQSKSSMSGGLITQLACWDFVGYTGNNYGTKKGAQTQAIYKMVKRMLGIN